MVAGRGDIFSSHARHLRIVAYIPMAVLSPAAGIAADRYNRKFISIFSDMTMGAAALIYSILLMHFDLPVWTVFILLCMRGAGSTFQQPAIQSIIPQLVPKDRLLKTNGIMQLMNSGSFLIGPVIGALLYSIFPIHVVLISDVLGAALASAALAAVRIPARDKEKQKPQQHINGVQRRSSDIPQRQKTSIPRCRSGDVYVLLRSSRILLSADDQRFLRSFSDVRGAPWSLPTPQG